jgi:hypothetical protein
VRKLLTLPVALAVLTASALAASRPLTVKQARRATMAYISDRHTRDRHVGRCQRFSRTWVRCDAHWLDDSSFEVNGSQGWVRYDGAIDVQRRARGTYCSADPSAYPWQRC